MRRLGLATVLLVISSSLRLIASDLPSPAVEAAQRLSFSGRFSEAKAKLGSILDAPASSREDKDDAAIELARIEWRIDDRSTLARARLTALLPEAKKKAKVLLLLSRMERTLGRFEPARAAARQALQTSVTPDDRDEATFSLAQALVEEELLAAREGKRAAFSDEGHGRLAEGLSLISPMVAERPGAPAPAQTLLDAALLLDDGPHALVAYRSYFASAGTADSALLSAARSTLSDLLPRWKGPQADRAERAALVKALADSRLFTEAVSIALDRRASGSGPPERESFVEDLVLYEAFHRRARAMTEDYYRDVSRRTAKPKKWRKAFEADVRRLWGSLRWEGKAPPFDEKLFEGSPDTELGQRFGLLLSGRGKTGNVEDLHAGHRVIDETRNVEQYGRRAIVRFVALDAMISNGYETWMWDGNGAHGGWGRTGVIVQVRPVYAGGGLFGWQELNDPSRRAKADERLAGESERDVARAAKDPYAYLPGLALRLQRQGRVAILEEERAKGLSGDELRSAFLAASERALQESSIFAHEGRHAIDAEFEKIKDSAAREYRAKLSEIAFAPAPRLAFSGILTDNIGNGSPHGQANLKLMKGLVAWMEEHRSEIAGLDGSRPLLPQLDKLTDDQLRAAARSLDPMAAPSKSTLVKEALNRESD
jgi:hypothetical protein